MMGIHRSNAWRLVSTKRKHEIISAYGVEESKESINLKIELEKDQNHEYLIS